MMQQAAILQLLSLIWALFVGVVIAVGPPGAFHDVGGRRDQCQAENEPCSPGGSALRRARYLHCCNGLTCQAAANAIPVRAGGGEQHRCVTLKNNQQLSNSTTVEEDDPVLVRPPPKKFTNASGAAQDAKAREREEDSSFAASTTNPPKTISLDITAALKKAAKEKKEEVEVESKHEEERMAFFRLFHYGDTTYYTKNGIAVPELVDNLNYEDYFSSYYFDDPEPVLSDAPVVPKNDSTVLLGGEEDTEQAALRRGRGHRYPGQLSNQAARFRRRRFLSSSEDHDDNPVISNTIKINCGGGAFDAKGFGVDYGSYGKVPHKPYKSGTVQIFNAPLHVPRTLYQSLRYGKAFSYSIPASAARNLVRLHFCDVLRGFESRYFRVDIEGVRVLESFNPARAAAEQAYGPGTSVSEGVAHAYIWQGLVEVKDGSLDISFTASREMAIINGIEVQPLDPWMLNLGSEGLSLPEKLTSAYYVRTDSDVSVIQTESVLHDFVNLENYPSSIYRKQVFPTTGSNLIIKVPVEAAPLRVLTRFHLSRSKGETYHITINGQAESPFVGLDEETKAQRVDFGRMVHPPTSGSGGGDATQTPMMEIEIDKRVNAIEIIPTVDYLIDIGCTRTSDDSCAHAKGGFWPERWEANNLFTNTSSTWVKSPTNYQRSQVEVKGAGLYSDELYKSYRYGYDFTYSLPTVAKHVELKIHFPREPGFLNYRMNIYVGGELVEGSPFDLYFDKTTSFLDADYDIEAYQFKQKFWVPEDQEALDIRFQRVSGYAVVSAIEMYAGYIEDPADQCVDPNLPLEPCGSTTPNECQRLLTDLLVEYGAQHNRRLEAEEGEYIDEEAEAEEGRRLTGGYTTKWIIDVWFTALWKNADKGKLLDEHLQGFMDALERHFVGPPGTPNGQRKTEFKFKFHKRSNCRTSTCFSWHYMSNVNLNVMKRSRYRNLVAGAWKTMNVYLGNPSMLGVDGQSTFPHGLYLDNNIDLDGVIIWNPDTVPSSFRGGLTKDEFAVKMYETLAHEAGHWLGLYHTFEGENCNSGDDGIGDTGRQECPASKYKNQYKTCFDGGSISTCPPSTHAKNNVMDYIWHECSRDHGKFTNDQFLRMKDQYKIWRRGSSRRRLSTVERNGDLEAKATQSCLYSMAIECDCDVACFGDVWDLMQATEFNVQFENILDSVRDVCNRCTDLYVFGGACRDDEICVPMQAQLEGVHSQKQLGNYCSEPFGHMQEVLDCRMCMSGYCDTIDGVKKCVSGDGGTCSSSSECYGNLHCSGGTCNGASSNDQACERHAECDSNYCDPGSSKCKACTSHTECGDTRYCENQHCVLKKDVGEACTDHHHDFECSTNKCDKKQCVECKTREDCREGHKCLKGGVCGQCLRQQHCPEGFYCDLGTFSPKNQGANIAAELTTSSTYQTCRRQKLIGIGSRCKHDYECAGEETTGCDPESHQCAVVCVDASDCEENLHTPICSDSNFCVQQQS